MALKEQPELLALREILVQLAPPARRANKVLLAQRARKALKGPRASRVFQVRMAQE